MQEVQGAGNGIAPPQPEPSGLPPARAWALKLSESWHVMSSALGLKRLQEMLQVRLHLQVARCHAAVLSPTPCVIAMHETVPVCFTDTTHRL